MKPAIGLTCWHPHSALANPCSPRKSWKMAVNGGGGFVWHNLVCICRKKAFQTEIENSCLDGNVTFCCMYRLNRNRHHLMPMYNFDVGEEDARWEADLLEDDREQQIALNVCYNVILLLPLLQPFYSPLSRTTRVSRYQKKHSPTHLF